MIKSFNQINKKDANIAGGKGASLGEMTQAGIVVPSGFVILSQAFENFIEEEYIKENNLQVEIDEADSSKSGMKKLRDQSFDCVLIDYIIPGISGLNVIQEVRKSGNNTPFIIMTGYGDKELKKELIKEGASDYISKDDLNLENLQYKINAVVADTIQNVQEEQEQSVKEGVIGQFIKSPPLIVDASLTIKEVIVRINEHEVGSLLVKEGEDYVGIVTKKDLVRKVIAKKL